MTIHNFGIIHIILFIAVAFFMTEPWPYLLLIVAQLVYLPMALKLIWVKDDWFAKRYGYFAMPAYIAIVWLHIMPASKWDILFAACYMGFTLVIALYGLTRFLGRGFTNLEEFSIDIGLIYVALGGGWFFTYMTGIDTGFSPLITWLTAIHFHYSALLLPIFIGFLGRLYKPRLYSMVCAMIMVAPLVVAVGIAFSRWLELLSVIVYIVGISGLIYITWKTPFINTLQKWLIRLSFSALGVTIVFSLLYTLGNAFGLTTVNMDDMLRFHGVLNCVVFALFGIIGWAWSVPAPSFKKPIFPTSTIRGKWKIGTQLLDNRVKQGHAGLVDDMQVYPCTTVSPRIIDFYEQTSNYRLFATVKWRSWFKPFAVLYALVSKQTQQINLPLHARQVEMTGDVILLQDGDDSRDRVRTWLRTIGNDTAFVALYSQHTTAGRTYMNIALPLPFTTMTGILELNPLGEHLQLTSKRASSLSSDAGIYLSWSVNQLFKLPLEENFIVQEQANGTLHARHEMWLCALPFLTIDYVIVPKEEST